MSEPALPTLPGPVIYPDSDGQPMAENTKQLRWIVVLYDNFTALFRGTPDVFVAADLLWYAVEGEPEIRQAPDVMVAFGRRKGHRGSYKQWEEGGIAPQVVFEILSPGNTATEMADKHDFYDEHGVEEYYIYDPDNNRLLAYVRGREALRRVRIATDFVSPRLGIRFDTTGPELVILRPDGQRFLTFEEVEAERARERQQRLAAEQRATQAEQRAAQAEQRATWLARLAELSRKARLQQATPEELAELERLEQQGSPSN
jgi:Uma2 family endonuclease